MSTDSKIKSSPRFTALAETTRHPRARTHMHTPGPFFLLKPASIDSVP